MLEFIPGEVPWPAAHRRLLGSVERVARMGSLLRTYHDAVADFDPGDDAIWQFPEMAADAMNFADERGLIICHNDPTAWNVVIGDNRWAFIDWDAAGPRPAIWDVAYCAIGVIPITPDTVSGGLVWSGAGDRATHGPGGGLPARASTTGTGYPGSSWPASGAAISTCGDGPRPAWPRGTPSGSPGTETRGPGCWTSRRRMRPRGWPG